MKNSDSFYVRLPIRNSVNVRDLGGYPGTNGKATKFKAFVRSGDLTYLDEEDIGFLIKYGINRVIDLRTDHEADKYRNPFIDVKGVSYHHCPFFLGELSRIPFDENCEDPMGDLYLDILEKCSDKVAHAVLTIANAEPGGILFHCSAGKDRTGILSYIILSLAGVSNEDIVANYRVTDSYYIPYAKRTFKSFDKIPIKYLQSNAVSMERAMTYVTDNFGGVENYLLSIGISEEEIKAVRDRII